MGIRNKYTYPRIDANIIEQAWLDELPAESQVAFFRLWLSCDVIGVTEQPVGSIPADLLNAMNREKLALYDDSGNALFCDYIHTQIIKMVDIPSMIKAFVECPVPLFKAYLAERYHDIFTEERLDKYNHGVLVRNLGVPFSVWSKLRAQVFVRDGFVCRYCGKHVADPHCDHVIPLCKGGKTVLDNLVTACPSCNCSKHDKTLEEWRKG